MIATLQGIWDSLKKWALGWWSGKPHFVVGPKGDPYLLRWYLIPRNPLFNVYLHQFIRDDDDRALHDHPWASLSITLWGGYTEVTIGEKHQRPGSVVLRGSTHKHRVILPRDREGKPVPAWTLFFTGPRVRDWYFHCPQGPVPWQEFTKPGAEGEIGRGCGEHS